MYPTLTPFEVKCHGGSVGSFESGGSTDASAPRRCSIRDTHFGREICYLCPCKLG